MTQMEKEATFTGNKHNHSFLTHDVVVYLVKWIPITSEKYTFVLACHFNSYGYHIQSVPGGMCQTSGECSLS